MVEGGARCRGGGERWLARGVGGSDARGPSQLREGAMGDGGCGQGRGGRARPRPGRWRKPVGGGDDEKKRETLGGWPFDPTVHVRCAIMHCKKVQCIAT